MENGHSETKVSYIKNCYTFILEARNPKFKSTSSDKIRLIYF